MQHHSTSEGSVLDDTFILPKFPAPDTAAMDACQTRIDSLAKPIDSLGRLEELAVRFAGITQEAQPPLAPKRALLIFSAAELTQRQKQRTAAFAAHAKAPVTLTRLDSVSNPATAFLRGHKTVHALAADCSLIGISLAAPSDTAAKEKAALLEDTLHDAKCGDAPLDLLRRLPPALCIEAAALFGAISAAAERRSLILLDDPAGESIARCAETLSPTLSPYLLHMQSDYIALSLAASCGIAACLGMRLIDASLHMLNDMKTFAETAVAVAADGPGMGRQG